MPGLGAWRRRFLAHVLALGPAMLFRRTFVNLARQGDFAGFTYREHFARPVNWLAVNATYPRKASRHTAGVGYFHSGVHGRRQWGLETPGLGAVDLDAGQARHLEAVQTVARAPEETPPKYYAACVESRAGQLPPASDVLVAEAFYAPRAVQRSCRRGWNLLRLQAPRQRCPAVLLTRDAVRARAPEDLRGERRPRGVRPSGVHARGVTGGVLDGVGDTSVCRQASSSMGHVRVWDRLAGREKSYAHSGHLWLRESSGLDHNGRLQQW